MIVEITNVGGNEKNQWVGTRGEAIRTIIYPGDDDYFVEVKIKRDFDAPVLLFKLSEIKIIHEEKPHWFITVYPQRIEGRCSDGRTFGQPCGLPQIWTHGFTTALDMSGQTYEIREEDYEKDQGI